MIQFDLLDELRTGKNSNSLYKLCNIFYFTNFGIALWIIVNL